MLDCNLNVHVKSAVKIFVVDDEPDIRNLLKSVVSLENYQAIATSSSRETLYELSKLDQKTKYVFIIDYRLGYDNGVDLCYALRERNIDCVIILISAGEDPTIHEWLNDCEDTDSKRKDDCNPFKIFLPKPFSNEKLMEIVRKYT